MKMFALIALLATQASAFAAEQCFQVTTVKDAWSRTPELLCIDENEGKNEYALSLKSGLSFNQQTIAIFSLNLLQRARCMDCNQDIYGVSNPSNSSFNKLAIRFDGKRDRETMREEGTVFIGETKFFYRSR